MLPYFRRDEPFEGGGDDFHGGDGPWKIRTTDVQDPIFDSFFDAVESAGYEKAKDYNGAAQEGFARLQVNAVKGRRQSAAVAYLRPAMKRPNVEVQVKAHVTRVLFEGNRAVGVEYLLDGRTFAVRAAKEVILSGGAINSPQVLMLSGVGPGEHLSAMGVTVHREMAGVGSDLQDHPAVGLEYFYSQGSKFHRQIRLDRLAFHVARVRLFGTGMAASPPSSLTGFVRSRPDLELPDIQMFFRPMSMTAREWFPGILPPAASSRLPRMRSRISRAALLVKVTASTSSGFSTTASRRR